ncbi:MAG TPA: hypothetical protein VGW38_20390 [Chloroflexota bacterium]|nr:hypothetical protein [Chloroflexota bacterium]
MALSSADHAAAHRATKARRNAAARARRTTPLSEQYRRQLEQRNRDYALLLDYRLWAECEIERLTAEVMRLEQKLADLETSLKLFGCGQPPGQN